MSTPLVGTLFGFLLVLSLATTNGLAGAPVSDSIEFRTVAEDASVQREEVLRAGRLVGCKNIYFKAGSPTRAVDYTEWIVYYDARDRANGRALTITVEQLDGEPPNVFLETNAASPSSCTIFLRGDHAEVWIDHPNGDRFLTLSVQHLAGVVDFTGPPARTGAAPSESGPDSSAPEASGF